MPRNLLVVGHATRARCGLAGFEPGCIYVGLLMGRSILPTCSRSRSSRLMAPTLVLSAVVLQRACTAVLPPSTPHAPHVPPHAPCTPLSSHMLLTLLPRTLCSTSPPKHCMLELEPLRPSTFLAPLMGSTLLSLTLLLMLLALLLALSSHRLSGCTVDFMPPKAVDGVLTQISEGRTRQ